MRVIANHPITLSKDHLNQEFVRAEARGLSLVMRVVAGSSPALSRKIQVAQLVEHLYP